MKKFLIWLVVLTGAAVLRAQDAMPVLADIADMAKIGDSLAASVTNDAGRAMVVERLQAAALSNDVSDAGIPLEDISFPMSTYEDGSARVQFSAKKALLPSDNDAFVRANGIRMEHFATDADSGYRLEGILMAENGIFDRATHIGYSQGWVRLQYKNFKIIGTNMVWDADSRNVRILDGARVEMVGLMKNLGSVFKR